MASNRLFFVLIVAGAVITACSRNASPLIGISCARSSSGNTLLNTTYTDAIRKAGGTPFVIPTVCNMEEAAAVLEALDGIVFSGGEDVSPEWYGEAPFNETVECDRERDRSDSLLARAAFASGKPVLAICRGSQLLNVLLGGSLWQDLPSQYPGVIRHGGGVMHTASVEADSFLSDIYGTDSLSVISWHHQAAKDIAPGIRVISRSSDGVVEAWETPQIWAVQFHPEKMLASGDTSWLPLFEAYVKRVSR